ncbi:hypothetical protein CHU98_g449 [Xylaria longipes]|nr:hypothetical protein CHU98_g449 [Xylaria longipes]
MEGLSNLSPVNDPRDVIRTQETLTQYFNRDEENRFYMERAVGGGMFGLTWKLRYMTPLTNSSPAPSSQHIVLKTDRVYSLYDDAPGEEEEKDEEDDMYDVLRWSKHIVNDVTPTRDPLARQFPGVRSHRMDVDNWLYLEWLENGTLKRFVNRAKQRGIQLPNRMCIAMGWPPEKPEGEDEPITEIANGPARGGLIHGDMHDQNVMFGNFIPNDPDTEHRITPILKLIDLGGMRVVADDRDSMRGAVHENIFDIGIFMIELITLSSDEARAIYPSESLATKFSVNPDSQEMMTNGGIILPNGNINPYPKLDTALRGLICACLATKPGSRPRVSALANIVTTCINNRDGQFYASRGYAGESDDDIRTIINQLIFNAS